MAQRTVLVVDDNDDLRAMFGFALTVAGYQVKEAGNGLDALRRLDADPPDAVVLDLGLPQISGQDVLADLRLQAATKDIPVIVVTGSAERLEDIDADCVLRKPVSAVQLVETVRRCLEKRSN